MLSTIVKGIIALAMFKQKELNTQLISDVIIEYEFDSTGSYR